MFECQMLFVTQLIHTERINHTVAGAIAVNALSIKCHWYRRWWVKGNNDIFTWKVIVKTTVKVVSLCAFDVIWIASIAIAVESHYLTCLTSEDDLYLSVRVRTCKGKWVKKGETMLMTNSSVTQFTHWIVVTMIVFFSE